MADNQEKGVLFAATTPVLMTFPNLLEAKRVKRNGKETGDPKYSANFEFDLANADQVAMLTALRDEMLRIAAERWPHMMPVTDLYGGPINFPVTRGDFLADKAKAKDKDREFSRGKVVLVARSKYQPNLSALLGGKLVEFNSEDTVKANGKVFYSGSDALFQINLQAYDAIDEGDKPGITAYLNQVCSLNRGKKLTGTGASAATVFSGYVGTVSQVDPTVGQTSATAGAPPAF
jgi:hypothetical protein